MIALILSVLVLAGLLALGWQIRGWAREMKGLGDDEGPKTEAGKNARIQKETERWRNGE